VDGPEFWCDSAKIFFFNEWWRQFFLKLKNQPESESQEQESRAHLIDAASGSLASVVAVTPLRESITFTLIRSSDKSIGLAIRFQM
jgi:hypothetical protein